MTKLIVTAGPFTFDAQLRDRSRAEDLRRLRRALPFESKIVHVRWSGEGVWMPLGDLDFGVGYENHTSYPAPGQIILYPGGISETEILLAYGGVHFASKMGQLAGNHFITLTSGLREPLPARPQDALGRRAADPLRARLSGARRRRRYSRARRPPRYPHRRRRFSQPRRCGEAASCRLGGGVRFPAQRQHGAGDLRLAHDRQRRAAFGQVLDLGVGMRAGDDRQRRIVAARLLADLARLEALRDRDEEPLGARRARPPPALAGSAALPTISSAPSRLAAVDRVGLLLDHQKLFALRDQTGAEQRADAAIADDDHMTVERGRNDIMFRFGLRLGLRGAGLGFGTGSLQRRSGRRWRTAPG